MIKIEKTKENFKFKFVYWLVAFILFYCLIFVSEPVYDVDSDIMYQLKHLEYLLLYCTMIIVSFLYVSSAPSFPYDISFSKEETRKKLNKGVKK